jgi:hypothetical protein
MVAFKKAERTQTHLKIGLAGPSGSGKTYSSLRLATGFARKLGSRIAVIDTENGSASLYSDDFDFDVLELEAPFTVPKYEEAVKSAIATGYKVIVVDSISHQWAAEGGILDRKAKMDAGGGNSYTHWAKLTPDQERFRSLILQSNAHMICTMRSKQDYVLVENDRGKQVPQKVGMAPVQREGMEYELTTVLDIDMANQAKPSKDRTKLFAGFHEKLTEVHGENFYAWWKGAKSADLAPDSFVASPTTIAPVSTPASLAAEEDVDLPKQAPPAATLSQPPLRPGVACTKPGCAGQVVMSSSRTGYICEMAEKRGDGHLRFFIEDLSKYLKANAVPNAQAG